MLLVLGSGRKTKRALSLAVSLAIYIFYVYSPTFLINPQSSLITMDDSGYATPPKQRQQDVDLAEPPPRPCRMFNINADSPSQKDSASCEMPMQHCEESDRISNNEELSVLTWNVWFSNYRRADRHAAILATVISLSPDVACFQEVTGSFLKALKSNREVMDRYRISDNPIYDYGIFSIAKKGLGFIIGSSSSNKGERDDGDGPSLHEDPRYSKYFRMLTMGASIVAVKNALQIDGLDPATIDDIAASSGVTFEEMDLPGRMGRSLLVTKVPFQTEKGQNKFILIGNVHLESLDNEPLRRRQLIVSSEYLSQEEQYAPMLVGDFNFDSMQTWGDWKRPLSEHRSASELENNVLIEVIPQWLDAWPHLKGVDEGADVGITFDGATNPVCVRDKKERMRYDRIMVKKRASSSGGLHLSPLSIGMVGTDAIDDKGLKPSDHYGLLIKLKICV